MRDWRDKLMEQIEPSTTYTRQDTCALVDAPNSWLDTLAFPLKGNSLLMALLEYVPVRGRVPKDLNRKRMSRLHLRLSLQQKEFLDRLATCYGQDVCAIIRCCCFDRELSPERLVNVETEMQLSFIEEHIQNLSSTYAIKPKVKIGITELKELLHKTRDHVLAQEPIESPTILRPKPIRFTIRFTREEALALKQKQNGVMARYIWKKVTERKWICCQTINEQAFLALAAVQRSLGQAVQSSILDEIHGLIEKTNAILRENFGDMNG